MLAYLFAIPAAAASAEPSPTNINEIIERWAQASRSCESLHTRLTIFDSSCFSDKPTKRRGRFLYQSAGDSRYDDDDTGGFIWRDDGVTFIDERTKSYVRFSKEDQAAARERKQAALAGSNGWWTRFNYALIGSMSQRVDEVIPHLLLLDPELLRGRYDLTIETREVDRVLKARSKTQKCDDIAELWFLFADETHFPKAVRQVRVSGGYTTWALYDVLVNEVPADRDEFLNPSLRLYQRRTK